MPRTVELSHPRGRGEMLIGPDTRAASRAPQAGSSSCFRLLLVAEGRAPATTTSPCRSHWRRMLRAAVVANSTADPGATARTRVVQETVGSRETERLASSSTFGRPPRTSPSRSTTCRRAATSSSPFRSPCRPASPRTSSSGCSRAFAARSTTRRCPYPAPHVARRARRVAHRVRQLPLGGPACDPARGAAVRERAAQRAVRFERVSESLRAQARGDQRHLRERGRRRSVRADRHDRRGARCLLGHPRSSRRTSPRSRSILCLCAWI